MPFAWGLDLGTSNSVLAVCRTAEGSPECVWIEDLCLPRDHPLGAADEPTPLIPSIVELPTRDLARAFVGRQAVDRHFDEHVPTPPQLARRFKLCLGDDPHHPVAHAHWGDVSARLAAAALTQGILTGARRSELGPHGVRAWLRTLWRGWPDELVIPAPVCSFERYLAEVRRIARRCGVRDVHFIEEPVAAALGYGLDVGREQVVLIIDFGGGTLNLAVVRLGADAVKGRTSVLATAGAEIGGETVNDWLCEEVAARSGMDAEWVRAEMLWDVETAKKKLSRRDSPGATIGTVQLTRDELIGLLEQRGVYERLRGGLAQVVEDARPKEPDLQVAEVLLIGGSTLLPRIAEEVEAVAGLRPRHWRPFEAVARGAALFGAGRAVDPVFYHDYAVRLQVQQTHPPEFEYERLIAAGSPYPTPRGAEVVHHYQVRPGMDRFSLPICELGRFGWQALAWSRRENGSDYWHPTDAVQRGRVRCLNEGAPDLPLRPPSRDSATRLRVRYRVDRDRQLRVEVTDLMTKAVLLRDEVVATLAEGGG
ncbi:MAG: Hsp70 family protein [Armatimonadetes bacterium]|nr:Hsp70 family protein [Armatimonadota bacterium]